MDPRKIRMPKSLIKSLVLLKVFRKNSENTSETSEVNRAITATLTKDNSDPK
jgi:hypothetical protein